jgi:hypothetical protein
MAGGSSGGPRLTLTVDEHTGELRTTAPFGTTLDGDAQSLYAAGAKL